ncbi:MAG: TonB-dependent receptor [Balneolales bacterium]
MKKIITFTFSILLLSCMPLAAQVSTITGTVTDASSGETLIGVNILEKGTTNGTATNIDGEFSLTLNIPGTPLIFSYIGYERIELSPETSEINVQMVPTSGDLEELVIVGYSSQRKASVVGSISTTTSVELQKMGTPNLSNALAGRVSGVVSLTGSGRPGGDDAELFIRGRASLGTSDDDYRNSAPLILVDGVERDISRVHPEDIESFSVLKDASATAVYGVRGANGVILVTTKRGKVGKPEVSVRYNTTMQQPVRLPTFLGSYDHARLRNEALINDNESARYTEEDLELYQNQSSPYTHPDNDYLGDFLRASTPMHTANVNVSGGTDRLRYFVGTNATFQDGIYEQFDDARYPSNAHYKHLNLRSNLDYDITNTTTMSIDLNSRLEREQNTSPGDIGSTSIFAEAFRTPPNYYVYKLPNDTYGTNADDGNAVNLYALLNEYGHNRMNENILEGTGRLNQKLDFITPGLEFKGMASFNSYYDSGTKLGYRPEAYVYNPDTEEYTLMSEETVPWTSGLGNTHRRRNQMEVSLNWMREYGDHDLSAMALYTQTQGYTNHNIPQAFLGYVGRTTYGYRGEYLAEFNFGYNGSDQFEASKRFGFFPSLSLGWVMSQRSFIKDNLPAISFLKLRGSYGLVGNDKIGTDRFLFLQTYSPLVGDRYESPTYWFGTDENAGPVNTLFEGGLGNENVTWEVGKKSNLGLELMVFEDKLSLEVDVFNENREKIFIQRTTSPTLLGVSLPQENIGEVQNRGYEIETEFQDQVGNFGYFIGGLVSYSKNKIINTDELPPEEDYMARTGQSVGQNFGLEVVGYYTPDDFQKDAEGNLIIDDGDAYVLNEGLSLPSWGPVQPGDFLYLDRNDDGVINTFDHGVIGNSRLPQYIFSLSTGLNYKGWDFSMMWQGAAGHHKFITGSGAWEPVREKDRFMERHLYRWTEERWENGEEILYPRLSSVQSQHNHQNNSFFMEKGDYLRLKNLEIGYAIPSTTLSNWGISSLRVYATGTNLLTFSYIENFDPEVGQSSGIAYPQMRLMSFGMNLRF